MVFDGSLGGLDSGLQEGVGIAGKLEHDLDMPGVALGLWGGNGGRISHHAALYEILLRAGISDGCQGIENQLGIQLNI